MSKIPEDAWLDEDVTKDCPGAFVVDPTGDGCPCCCVVVHPDDATEEQLELLTINCRGSGGWGLVSRSRYDTAKREQR